MVRVHSGLPFSSRCPIFYLVCVRDAIPDAKRGKRNKLVVHTVPYDLTILEDGSMLNERSSSISVPTLVIGGEKSPKELHDAVTALANVLPNGHGRYLSGQDHNISSGALAPILFEYFGTS